MFASDIWRIIDSLLTIEFSQEMIDLTFVSNQARNAMINHGFIAFYCSGQDAEEPISYHLKELCNRQLTLCADSIAYLAYPLEFENKTMVEKMIIGIIIQTPKGRMAYCRPFKL